MKIANLKIVLVRRKKKKYGDGIVGIINAKGPGAASLDEESLKAWYYTPAGYCVGLASARGARTVWDEVIY